MRKTPIAQALTLGFSTLLLSACGGGGSDDSASPHITALQIGDLVLERPARPVDLSPQRAVEERVQEQTPPATSRPAPQPQFGDSYLYRLVNAVAHLRDELDHRQHIENYVLGLTHELKTPLTAQQAALELLQDSPLSPDQQQLLDRIRRNTQKQKQLITRLLELARLENRDSLNDTQTVDLANLAVQAAQESRAALQAKQLHIALNCPPHAVQGDPLLLRQAIDNLLYNAIDFAEPSSEIRLSLTRSRNRTELAVYNQGSPVPDYALSKIPQRFYSLPRADGSRSSGLGLSFTTEIMRLHHGRLMLANRKNGVEARLVFPDV